MGLKSRRKGKTFERKIARRLQEEFPHLAEEIRRSIQSRGAEESDVVGLPGFWIECQDANQPTPLEKLEQAEGDLVGNLTPIAVTHKTGARSIQVMMRLKSLIDVLGIDSELKAIPVTLDFEDFLSLCRRGQEDATATKTVENAATESQDL